MSKLNESFATKLENLNQKLQKEFVLKDYPPLSEAEFEQSVVGDKFSLAGFARYLVQRYSLSFIADDCFKDLFKKTGLSFILLIGDQLAFAKR